MPVFHLMTKPIGPICNLECRYCFYLEKEALYPGNRRWRMDAQTLEAYVRQSIEATEAPEVAFAWQGGEPTLLGVDFFREAVALQRVYAGGKRITNAIQTNGVLLDDEWCRFLRENDVLVGLSIDGPRDLHDAYRVDRAGKSTFDAVVRAADRLKKHGVAFNTLTVVNRLNSRQPRVVYRFLKEIGAGFMQLIPLVERAGGPPSEGAPPSFAPPPVPGDAEPELPVTAWSVEPEAYGEFLVQIFDLWIRRDVGRVFVQLFDVALSAWAGLGAPLCVFGETCGLALAVEHNGDVYSCDHYVYPRYRLGNVMTQALDRMVGSEQQRRFGNDKRDTLPAFCRTCRVRFVCNGECPKHRFAKAPDGEAGLNYLCAAYKRFFAHVEPHMEVMVRLLREGRAPAEIMGLLRGR